MARLVDKKLDQGPSKEYKEWVDMKSQKEEISHSRKGSKALFSIAAVAIFLLAGIGFGVKALIGSAEAEVNMLSMEQAVYAGNGILSSQVRSDQAITPEAPELVLLAK